MNSAVDLTIVLEAVTFALLMCLSAFISGSKISLFSLSHFQQKQTRQAGKP